MTKRKTRKQKENLHHPFLVEWSPTQRVYDPAGGLSHAHVKRESNLAIPHGQSESKPTKSADLLAQDEQVRSTKKGMLKSVIVTSLILILEVVVYLALK